ncbi:MAG: hypothetical protein ACLUTU_09790 [Blautia faecis]
MGKFKRKKMACRCSWLLVLCCTRASFRQAFWRSTSAQDEIVQEEVQTLKSEEELIGRDSRGSGTCHYTGARKSL